MSGCEAGFLHRDLLEHSRGLFETRTTSTTNQRPALEVELVRLHIGLVSSLSSAKRQSQLVDDRPRDVVLNVKDVPELPIERLRPEQDFPLDHEQIRVDAQPVARLQYGPIDDEVDDKLLADFGQVARLILEGERRIARPHVQPLNAAEVADDFVGQPVHEVAAPGFVAQVLERKHGNDRL